VLFVKLLYWTEDLFDGWKKVPEWVKPAVGGALLGGLALAYPLITPTTWTGMPQIFNVGYDLIESALSNQLLLGVVLSLLFLKIIATCLTLGSGGSGGVFAPSLFMGAMLGTAFELIVRIWFPSIVAPPGAYALVGMAAVFAAAAHAPITAVIILFELTGDYLIVLPLMLTVVISTLLAQKMLAGESIYTLKLSRRGVHLKSGQDVDVMDSVLVEDVMTRSIDTILSDATLAEFSEVLAQTHHHGLPVLDQTGRLWGIATITDLERALERHLPENTSITEIGTGKSTLLVAYPDESMGEALARMGIRGVGRLPVVAREDSGQLLGLIRRADIIRAYNLALTRRTNYQQRIARVKRSSGESADFIELPLAEDFQVIGQKVVDLAGCLPEDSILISINRAGKVIIPHGDTTFQAGDIVTAFVRQQDIQALHSCMRGDDTDGE
jgi:CIC family chloride channel protein